MSDKIIFQKERLLGDIISDTFEFIRQTIREMGKALLYLVGPFIVLNGIAAGIYQSKMLKGMSNLMNQSANPETFTNPFASMMGIEYIFIVIFSFIISILLLVISCESIMLYMDGGAENVTYENIMTSMKRGFGFMTWTVIVTAFAIVIAMGLFILPGIYIAVVLSIIPMVRVYEKKGMYRSIRRSMTLVSGNWWRTVGIILVFSIIVGFASIIFQVPNYILIFYTTMHTISSQGDSSGNMKMLFILASVFSQLVYLMNAIPVIGLALHYFSLVEKKDATGIENRVDSIGEGDEE